MCTSDNSLTCVSAVGAVASHLEVISQSGPFPAFNTDIKAVAQIPGVTDALAWCSSFFADGALKALKLKDVHVFAFCGSEEVVGQALANGMDFNAKDIGGRTPQFYAALRTTKEIYEQIKEKNAKPTRDIYGGSASDAWKLIHPDTSLTCSEGICTQKNVQFEESCFPKDVSVLSTTTVEAKTLLRLWKENTPSVLQEEQQLLEATIHAFRQFKEAPPKLAVKTVVADDRGNPLAAGCGLFVTAKVKKGELIGEYGGLLTITKPIDHEYQLDQPYNGKKIQQLYLDAKKWRTPVSMSNDGYPNAHILVRKNTDGVPVRAYLEALNDIQPGEQIVWDYMQNHEIKVIHQEPRPAALDNAIRGKSYSKLVALSELSKEKMRNMVQNFAYLASTPSSVIRLLAEQALKFEDYAQGVLQHPFREVIINTELSLDMLYLVNKVFTKVRAQDPSLLPSFVALFLKHKGDTTDTVSSQAARLVTLHNAAYEALQLLKKGTELQVVLQQIESNLEGGRQIFTSLARCNDYLTLLNRRGGYSSPQLKAHLGYD